MGDTPYCAEFDAKTVVGYLTERPGVYRMIGRAGEALYVGKARNLKKRVSSYFNRSSQDPKTRALVSQIQAIEVTVTRTEGEALILENNLIKSLKPRYNILLRDDKSYPYLYLSSDQNFPRLTFHRGPQRDKGRYFGPYPSAGAVRESLNQIQKLFQIRQCEDSFFRNRSRPCLQYQIRRCTAPCVGLVDRETYQDDVRHAVLFLEGKSSEVIDELIKRMERAANKLEFEEAARYRDRIARLHRVQDRQYMSSAKGDLDVVACAARAGEGCVQVFYVRAGRNLGNKSFFPRVPGEVTASEMLAAFLPQYYLDKQVPTEILVSHGLEDAPLLEEVLESQCAHKVTITHRVRGERSRWLELAIANAEQALGAHQASKAGMRRRLEALQEALGLDQLPARLECFDISHTMGEATVASCVVFSGAEPLKSDYRRFNIEGIRPGDDYAALGQVLMRRYTRLKRNEAPLPDLLFIDGGSGQVARARGILEELQVEGVIIIGIAKGPLRKRGRERLILSSSGTSLMLPPDSPALHLIQHIRDEAHHFAITGHRKRRASTRRRSVLEAIPGMGPKRRQSVLKQFGGLRGVECAGVEDLARVHGISRALAQRIYDALHSDEP
jgi:excinuclease ABC, C subunit